MRKITLLFLLLATFPLITNAQGSLKISGKVTDTFGEPLVGASVYIKALNTGGATNFEGNYSFEIPRDLLNGQEVELTVSFIGYKKQVTTIKLVSGSLPLNFKLEEDVFQSETVVVTGIASKTSKAVAEVAVSRISATDLVAKQAYSGLSQLISGKIAGVTVQTASGNVGGGWRFIMRSGGGLNGNGQPVIYVDGVRVNSSDIEGNWVGGQTINFLSNLNPNDIENIEILKGPSAAAMYGTSGSNGVVLITTKKGALVQGLSRNMSINYQFNYGTNTRSFTFDAERWTNAPIINSVLEPPGYIQEHTVSISGGNNYLRYYTSFQDRNEDGLIPSQNTMNRRSLRANISAFPSDNLSFSLNSSYVWNKLQRPYNDNNIIGWMLNAFSYYPAFSTTDSVAISKLKDWSYIDQFIGSAKMTWKPISDLEIQGSFGIDYSDFRQDQLRPYGYKYSSNTTGARYIYNRQAYRFTYDINARYNFENLFDGFNLTTVVGAQLLQRDTRTQDAGALYFNHPDITVLQTGTQMSYMDNSYSFGKEAGLFWENNFSYLNTYFWTLAIRKDYANSIGKEAPSITYPKVSGAIRLDKFGILPEEISLLKLRFAYGESGQLPGRLDGIPLTWTASAGGNGVGLVGNSLGNPAVEPERVKEFEIGFDTEFLKMFSLEFTYYTQKAEKSLVYSTLAPSYGFGGLTYPYNLGEVKGSGFESMLQINPIRTIDYDLSLSFIWNYQTSEIISLGNSPELYNAQNVEKVGFRKHQFYSIKTTTPIFDASGQLTGYNNTGSRVDCGNPIPDHSGSFTINFRFLKNFNFYAFSEFGLNNYVYSYTFYRGVRAGSANFANKLATQLGVVGKSAFPGLRNDPSVTPLTPGTPEYIKAAEEMAKIYYRDIGNFIFPADFFIIREVSLSYNFTELMQEFIPNKYLNEVIAGFSVRNVFRTSKYEFDFESNYTGGANSGTYSSDFATLPQPRTFNFWVKFGF